MGRNVEEVEEIFTKGSRVEVTSNEEGFTGAWYVATVLATPSSKSPPPKKRSRTGNRETAHMYLVQYETLLTDDNPSEPLTEYVDVSYMRPEQPTEDDGQRCGFEVNDVVDVNLRDGWWTGVVKRVVDSGSKVLVFFQNPPDEVECDGSEVRIHLEWVDRKWVRPTKQAINESKDEEKRTPRKKRGSPQESSGKFPKSSRKGEKHDISVGALNQIVVKNVARMSTRLQKDISWSDSFNDFPFWISNKECLNLIADSKQFLSGARHTNSRLNPGEIIFERLDLTVVQNRGECLDKTISVNGFPTQDPLDDLNGISSEDSGARDGTDLIINDKLASHKFDEGALLPWYDGLKSTATMNHGVSNGKDPEVNAESSERQNHKAAPPTSPEVGDKVEESQNLPFIKSSPVWKSIESLDVFQKTPQRPHFSSLVKCRADSREGLAVGHMVTFANLVERTSNIQISHPQSMIESSLETLKELESHGFEVEAVRNRLTQLQSLKEKVGVLEKLSKEAGGEMMKLDEEKDDIEELMDKVEEKMKQIKVKLETAASMRETKVKQISILQSKLNFFTYTLENTERDFEKLAASPL